MSESGDTLPGYYHKRSESDSDTADSVTSTLSATCTRDLNAKPTLQTYTTRTNEQHKVIQYRQQSISDLLMTDKTTTMMLNPILIRQLALILSSSICINRYSMYTGKYLFYIKTAILPQDQLIH